MRRLKRDVDTVINNSGDLVRNRTFVSNAEECSKGAVRVIEASVDIYSITNNISNNRKNDFKLFLMSVDGTVRKLVPKSVGRGVDRVYEEVRKFYIKSIMQNILKEDELLMESFITDFFKTIQRLMKSVITAIARTVIKKESTIEKMGIVSSYAAQKGDTIHAIGCGISMFGVGALSRIPFVGKFVVFVSFMYSFFYMISYLTKGLLALARGRKALDVVDSALGVLNA